MTRIITVLLAAWVSFNLPSVAEGASVTNDLALSLSVIEPVIPEGSAPSFRLTVTNVSGHVCRVLDLARRADLRDTYCNLVALKDGKPVDVPRAISDPGPLSDSDWLEIRPGGAKTFLLS